MSLKWAEIVSTWSNWGLLGALIAGVVATFGIYVSGNVKEKAASMEIARLNERALSAELELARLKSPRNISPLVAQRIVMALKPFGPRQLNIGILNGGLENGSLIADQLINILLNSLNWKLVPATSRNGNGQPLPNKGITRIIGISGIKIFYDSDKEAELKDPATVLANELNGAGIDASVSPDSDGTPNTIIVSIGAKT